MHCLGTWNPMMFIMILDDLIAFTCILRIYEGSELVLLGAEVTCTGFIHLGCVWRFLIDRYDYIWNPNWRLDF